MLFSGEFNGTLGRDGHVKLPDKFSEVILEPRETNVSRIFVAPCKYGIILSPFREPLFDNIDEYESITDMEAFIDRAMYDDLSFCFEINPKIPISINIPEKLLKYADIAPGGDIIIVGIFDHVQLYSHETHSLMSKALRERLREDPDYLDEFGFE